MEGDESVTEGSSGAAGEKQEISKSLLLSQLTTSEAGPIYGPLARASNGQGNKKKDVPSVEIISSTETVTGDSASTTTSYSASMEYNSSAMLTEDDAVESGEYPIKSSSSGRSRAIHSEPPSPEPGSSSADKPPEINLADVSESKVLM